MYSYPRKGLFECILAEDMWNAKKGDKILLDGIQMIHSVAVGEVCSEPIRFLCDYELPKGMKIKLAKVVLKGVRVREIDMLEKLESQTTILKNFEKDLKVLKDRDKLIIAALKKVKNGKAY